MSKRKVTAIILCAGFGTRCKLGYNKLLYKVDGTTLLQKTTDIFLSNNNIDDIIIVVNSEDYDTVKSFYPKNKNISIVLGGEMRQQSVFNALKTIKNTNVVVIHDGARPYCSQRLLDECIESAFNTGSGVSAIKAVDSVCTTSDGFIDDYLERDRLLNLQTPQAFDFRLISKAYAMIERNENFTDDSSVFHKYIKKPTVVEGDSKNTKITFKSDLETNPTTFRIGSGYDVHRLVKGRRLILGGVQILYPLGLLGHSDADVLVHSIMDALLSATNNRDIGFHFPDTDEAYAGRNSFDLLAKVMALVQKSGFVINNISSVIICEKPKLSPHIESMQEKLSYALEIARENINITVTTNEGLSDIGKGKAIAAHTTALLTKKQKLV